MSNLMEKFHSKICKHILMVNKRSNNIAVRLELGRLPLFVNITCRILKYYVKLCKQHLNPIVGITLKVHKENNKSWFTFIRHILDNIGVKIDKLNNNNINNRFAQHSVFNILKNITEKVYITKIKEYTKLVLYSSVKKQIKDGIILDVNEL
eukprot:GHVU01213695.1.p1 GENE.GHVU01213695.1~~GHVU01213695.1.p1  ORF type:complete len:151 (+),score=6.71 GHVU01213695.1:2-454(+)